MSEFEMHKLYKRRDDDTWVKATPEEEQRIRTQIMTGELTRSVFISPNPVSLNNDLARDADDWLVFHSFSPVDGGDEIARLCFARTGSLLSAAVYAQWELESMNHADAEESAIRLAVNAIDIKRQALSVFAAEHA